MSKGKNNSKTKTLNVRRKPAETLCEIADARGMKIYRAFELLLTAWFMLDDHQQLEAHKRLSEQKRELQTA